MGRRRRRRRPRRSSRRWIRILILGVTALLVTTAVAFPATSFSATSIDRTESSDVVVDADGAMGLDVAGTVTQNETSRLVNVTDRVEADVSVTVALRKNSTDKGDLVVDGTVVGNETSISLTPGEERQIDISVGENATGDINFDVTASRSDLEFEGLNRTTTIEEPLL